MCPKKPKKPKASTSFLDKSIPTTTASGRATKTTVRKEIEKVTNATTSAVSTEISRRAAEAYKKDPELFKQTLKSLAGSLGKLSLIVGLAYATWKAVPTRAEREDLITRSVFEALNKVKSQLIPRGLWRPEYFKPLTDQLYAYFRQEMANAQAYRK